jgi:hypothetical protein
MESSRTSAEWHAAFERVADAGDEVGHVRVHGEMIVASGLRDDVNQWQLRDFIERLVEAANREFD